MFSDRRILQVESLMMCLLALATVQSSSSVRLSNTLLYYIGAYTTISISIYYLLKNKYYSQPAYTCLMVYLAWAVICIFRGLFECRSFWVFNQLIRGTMATLVPVIIFLFSTPANWSGVFRYFNRFLVIFWVVLFGWALPITACNFFLAPFHLIYICFFKAMSSKWRWITLAVILMSFLAIENRSGVLKSLFNIMLLVITMMPAFIRKFSLNVLHWSLYVTPIVLLFLGLSGTYNIFNPAMNTVSRSTTVSYNDEIEISMLNEDMSVDTRSFIYIESIESAFENDHLFFGRTPARGYSSPYFYELVGKDAAATGIDNDERFMSEVGHLNTFVWQGLIGVILVTFLYLGASFLALYRSRNIYVKMLSVAVAFHWAFGWIENVWQFLLIDITIMLILAICYSPIFRQMTDMEFQLFVRDLFAPPSSPSYYEAWKKLQTIVKLELLKKYLIKYNQSHE